MFINHDQLVGEKIMTDSLSIVLIALKRHDLVVRRLPVLKADGGRAPLQRDEHRNLNSYRSGSLNHDSDATRGNMSCDSVSSWEL